MPGLTRRLPRLPREEDFTSPLRGPAVAARVGLWLGVCFALAALTGLWSHVAQSPDPWVPLPTGPSWLYRVTQGVHVLAGTAAVPLLLVKLWSVIPHLFTRPPVRPAGALLGHLAERASVAVLVSSALFELATGLANSAQWYPWGFAFPVTHYAVAWVAVGALLVHVAVKLPVVRAALGGPLEPAAAEPTAPRGPSRRVLLRSTWAAAGLAVLATAGASVPALRRVSVLAVRSGNGPQGVPVNRSAVAAGVVGVADDPGYRLTVTDGTRTRTLALTELAALPQVTATLPIACVEGWSASGTWGGVRVRDVLALVTDTPVRDVRVRSLQPRGPYRETLLPAAFVADEETLLALRLGGETLDLDHGYPCRIIAPARPGVLQTKWVSRLEAVRT